MTGRNQNSSIGRRRSFDSGEASSQPSSCSGGTVTKPRPAHFGLSQSGIDSELGSKQALLEAALETDAVANRTRNYRERIREAFRSALSRVAMAGETEAAHTDPALILFSAWSGAQNSTHPDSSVMAIAGEVEPYLWVTTSLPLTHYLDLSETPRSAKKVAGQRCSRCASNRSRRT